MCDIHKSAFVQMHKCTFPKRKLPADEILQTNSWLRSVIDIWIYFHILLKKIILSLLTKAYNGLGLYFYADSTFFSSIYKISKNPDVTNGLWNFLIKTRPFSSEHLVLETINYFEAYKLLIESKSDLGICFICLSIKQEDGFCLKKMILRSNIAARLPGFEFWLISFQIRVYFWSFKSINIYNSNQMKFGRLAQAKWIQPTRQNSFGFDCRNILQSLWWIGSTSPNGWHQIKQKHVFIKIIGINWIQLLS